MLIYFLVQVLPILSTELPLLDPTPPPKIAAYGPEYENPSPPCETACADRLFTVLGVLLTPGNISRAMSTACREYSAAAKCMLPLTHCPSQLIFESLTSGLRYMCIDQSEAFNALIGCVEKTSDLVHKGCDQQCQPNSLMTGMALKDTLMKELEKPFSADVINMRALLEPHMSRLFFGEGCRIAECLLRCYKNKYNMMCEGTAGSLLLEMISRPLRSSSNSTIQLSAFLGGLMPPQCNFVDHDKFFHVDAELDAEIKRMYHARKSSSLSEPIEIEKPFFVETGEDQSPFDTDMPLLTDSERRSLEEDETSGSSDNSDQSFEHIVLERSVDGKSFREVNVRDGDIVSVSINSDDEGDFVCVAS